MPGHVLGNGGLTDLNSQFQEFAVNSRCAPQRVRLRYRANQHADVRWNGWSPQAMSAFPSPEKPEASPMPGEHGLGLHDDDGGSPPMPDPRQPEPQQAVRSRQRDATRTSPFQDLMRERSVRSLCSIDGNINDTNKYEVFSKDR